jgi:glycosyltransferase involved in cell wall biosynthesis
VKASKLLICLPAYNEEENIGAVLDEIISSIPGGFDVLVVDDGSTDRTRCICKLKNIMVISQIYNMGYGAALKTAYKYATDHGYDYIIQMDADGQHDVSNIKYLYQALTEYDETAPDIVIGSRFLHSSVGFHIPFYKKFAISVFNLLIKLITKKTITDPTSGLQGVSRNAFSFYAKFNQFATDYPDANMIIQMSLNNFNVSEIPAVMHPRLKGVSMHSGVYKPMLYMIKMTISVFTASIRGVLNKEK